MNSSWSPGPVPLESTTLPERSNRDIDGVDSEVEVPALACIWSREEPNLMGAVLIPPATGRGPWTFGRGQPSRDLHRLWLVRQRPSVNEPAGPLCCPRVSRAQLRISLERDGSLLVENIGACALVQGGREVRKTRIYPGEVLALRHELLFLCVRRTPVIAPVSARIGPPGHAFGQPDAFGLVGETPVAWALRQRILAVADQPHHVLILGESGAGKELVARAVHAWSSRGNRPMVCRNAATIPEGLADAELFGNLRNYPNPGMPERPGLIGEANQSTLFLDEFGDLPARIQAHLLRVMEEGDYQRLGEAKARRADVRVLAATNRGEDAIKHDLLARLKIQINVPDLNSRREDIPLLAVHLLRRHARAVPLIAHRFFDTADAQGAPFISPGLMETLVRHTYTTHVRELEALLVRATLEARGRYLGFSRGPEGAVAPETRPAQTDDLASCLDCVERERLDLLRLHRFSPTDCGRDPKYPGNRQNADLHLRILMCKVLGYAKWDTDRAAQLLAGSAAADLREKVGLRMATFLANLRARAVAMTPQELRQSILREWKTHAPGMIAMIEATREAKVVGSFSEKPLLRRA